MIDINELRRLAQAATPGPWYVGSGTYEGRNIYSVASVTDDEGFTYQPIVASVEDDDIKCWDANARLIAAANPSAVIEFLDRLEAAESDALEQARLNGMGASREAALLAKLEAAEKERDALRAELETERMRLTACGVVALSNTPDSAKQARDMRPEYWSASCGDVARMVDENIKLHAKIEAMEQQEPVAWLHESRRDSDVVTSAVKHVRGKAAVGSMAAYSIPLYLAPGAKGEEK